MDPRTQLATNVRRRRKDASLTQEALAGLVGTNTSEISRLERGERDPRMSTLVRVARALGISLSELVADVR